MIYFHTVYPWEFFSRCLQELLKERSPWQDNKRFVTSEPLLPQGRSASCLGGGGAHAPLLVLKLSQTSSFLVFGV